VLAAPRKELRKPWRYERFEYDLGAVLDKETGMRSTGAVEHVGPRAGHPEAFEPVREGRGPRRPS
jgi:hypothetical protein